MYCPRCGEQQPSDNLRFCNRCGLPLGLVAEVLSNGGTLPQLEELYQSKSIFTRRNGAFFSIVWFIFFVPFGAAFWSVVGADELSAVSAVFGVFSSILILLFSLFFLGKPKPAPEGVFLQNKQTVPQNSGARQNQQFPQNQQARHGQLPPQRQTPAAQEFASPGAGNWKYDTGELVEPGSVTEGTTKLLQKDRQGEEEEERTKYFK